MIDWIAVTRIAIGVVVFGVGFTTLCIAGAWLAGCIAARGES